ncbi:MAG: MBOAT family O-acyltransferase [Bacteroidia bacterium]
MVFSSPLFIFLFLPLVLIFTLFFTPGKYRNHTLLFFSLLFYAWGELSYTWVMIVSIALNYMFGLWIGNSSSAKFAKIALGVTIAANLSLLVYFKYAEFIVQNINYLLAEMGMKEIKVSKIHLPIGISFFTFHSLSYCIDVYRKGVKAQRSVVNVALYITLFPQLVAGPIIRYHDIAEQLQRRIFNARQFMEGVRRFIAGLAKKVLIANTMASIADQIFEINSASLSVEVAWLGIIAYTLQIYFDFSGYSDMAIGLGKMFGFDFLENFNYPYIANSIKEFWRRWHISLSNWFRDYLYIPLGGNKIGNKRTYVNLLLVFFITGLWHGASWNFIFWGMWHGFFLVIERLGMDKLLAKCWKPIAHVYTLLVVMIGWVYFRAENFEAGTLYIKSLFGINQLLKTPFELELYSTNENIVTLIVAVLFSSPIIKKILDNEKAEGASSSWKKTIVPIAESVLLLAVFILSLSSLASGTYNPFIYFRF